MSVRWSVWKEITFIIIISYSKYIFLILKRITGMMVSVFPLSVVDCAVKPLSHKMIYKTLRFVFAVSTLSKQY